jgi:spore germination protein GerM
MRTLFKMHPRDPDLGVTLPPATVRSVEIRDGVAWVDFSREVLVTGETAKTQRTALAAMIYTLSQFPGVEKVAFTVEGKTSGKLGGKDVATFWGTVNLKDMPWDISAKKTSE